MNPAYILRTLSHEEGRWKVERETSFPEFLPALKAANDVTDDGYAAVIRRGSTVVFNLGISSKDALLYGAPSSVGRLEIKEQS